ncbi:hypothetical protein P691DRAFT_811766 [Macrolepiota fuliginosa MF-IS2]|uniref:Uncharacterized protein n=1 Tax=Macrolepiota fuliginosa MF-IS2 TaxID=1400762 RepID=A0A9P6C9H2_9AGAR|nr:hypothetical protein P691DRAFT_811766 [Macrolepiota fuliginosa MF-IS2]
MAAKVLFCIPVYHGLLVSLVFQFVVDAAYAGWLFWWISRSHDDHISILESVVGCSLALAVWELYATFTASVGLYGLLRKKRFMKSFWKPQVFVLVCHIAICIWYIIVYGQLNNDKEVQDCKEKVLEGGGDEESETCQNLLSFRTAPLSFVWLSFLLEGLIQILVLYFLFQYRRVLNDYKVVDTAEMGLPLAAESNSPISRPSRPRHMPRPSDTSSLTLNETVDLLPEGSKSVPHRGRTLP